MTLRKTIKSLTETHLNNGGLLYSQSLIGKGSCANTIPIDHPRMIELPVCDASNAFTVVGAALAGTRPLYIIRFQGFVVFNGNAFPYMGMSNTMWDQPCPLFIRAMGNSKAIGPVASNAHHSVPMRIPGLKVVAPMSSSEYMEVWNEFMGGDDPIYCSESRRSYDFAGEYTNLDKGYKDTIIAIGGARLELGDFPHNIVHLFRLKPLEFSPEQISIIRKSSRVFVLDGDYNSCGISEHVAQEVLKRFGVVAYSIGLEDRVAGFSPSRDNYPKHEFYREKISTFGN